MSHFFHINILGLYDKIFAVYNVLQMAHFTLRVGNVNVARGYYKHK